MLRTTLPLAATFRVTAGDVLKATVCGAPSLDVSTSTMDTPGGTVIGATDRNGYAAMGASMLRPRYAGLASGKSIGEAIAAGMGLAKDLGNLPGNVCTPTHLAEQATAIAGDELDRLGGGLVDTSLSFVDGLHRAATPVSLADRDLQLLARHAGQVQPMGGAVRLGEAQPGQGQQQGQQGQNGR